MIQKTPGRAVALLQRSLNTTELGYGRRQPFALDGDLRQGRVQRLPFVGAEGKLRRANIVKDERPSLLIKYGVGHGAFFLWWALRNGVPYSHAPKLHSDLA